MSMNIIEMASFYNILWFCVVGNFGVNWLIFRAFESILHLFVLIASLGGNGKGIKASPSAIDSFFLL